MCGLITQTTHVFMTMSRAKEYYFKEGCFIEEWHNSPDDPAMSVARVRVEVAQTTRLHSLNHTTERYIMLSGEARVTVGSRTTTVNEGDVIVIQPQEAQKIENVGDQDLIFLAICTPRFEEKNYQEH